MAKSCREWWVAPKTLYEFPQKSRSVSHCYWSKPHRLLPVRYCAWLEMLPVQKRKDVCHCEPIQRRRSRSFVQRCRFQPIGPDAHRQKDLKQLIRVNHWLLLKYFDHDLLRQLIRRKGHHRFFRLCHLLNPPITVCNSSMPC